MRLCCTPNNSEQRRIDDQRRDRGGAVTAAAIDTLADQRHLTDLDVGIGDKSDQVHEDEQEEAVDDEAVDRDDNTPRGTVGGSR